MRRLNFPMMRRSISTGIDTMISLTSSLAVCRHDCYGNQRNRRRNASENLSWRISRYFNFRASLVFMQDGAPAHTLKMAIEWLKDHFPEKLILLKSEFIWPSRSPYPNHLHFYLWGYMKDETRRKKFMLQFVKRRNKSKRSLYQFLLKFCIASLENWAVALETLLLPEEECLKSN